MTIEIHRRKSCDKQISTRRPPSARLLARVFGTTRQEKDAKEQRDLNELAETDPAEYDRRIKEWHKRKMEERDGISRSLDAEDGDDPDQDQKGDLERRKALARERRDARYSLTLHEVVISDPREWFRAYLLALCACDYCAPLYNIRYGSIPTAVALVRDKSCWWGAAASHLRV